MNKGIVKNGRGENLGRTLDLSASSFFIEANVGGKKAFLEVPLENSEPHNPAAMISTSDVNNIRRELSKAKNRDEAVKIVQSLLYGVHEMIAYSDKYRGKDFGATIVQGGLNGTHLFLGEGRSIVDRAGEGVVDERYEFVGSGELDNTHQVRDLEQRVG